jgi:hypothetical protein
MALMLLIAISVTCATLLPELRYDVSSRSMLVKNDQVWQAYQRSLETFGADNVVIVYIQDDELFAPHRLAQIKQTATELNQLDFIKGNNSLFTIPNVKEDDEYIRSEPFLEVLPADAAQAQQVIDDAVRNPLVVGNVISADGSTMALNLVLDGAIHKPEQDQRISQQVEQVLDRLRPHVDVVFQMGSAYLRNEITGQLKSDQISILPLALGVLILVLGLSLRSLVFAVIPILTALMSIVAILAVMAAMNIPINVLTSIIPVLLIIIGSTEDVHLIAEYREGIYSGLSRDQAVDQLPVNQALAITLAFFTTFIGFLSITVSDLELLQEFGLLASLGLLLNFLMTMVFVPAYLKLFGPKALSRKQGLGLYSKLSIAIFRFVMRFKRSVMLAGVMVALVFLWGSQFLEVNNNTLAYFGEKSEVNARAELIHQNLAGMQTFSIILESPIEDTFLRVRYLSDIENIQNFIKTRESLDRSYSFADFVKLIHQVMDGTSQPEMPFEDELVEAYMGLVKPSSVKDYVSEDYSSARILIRHHIESSRQLDQELRMIRQFIEQDLNSSLKVSFTGESVLTKVATDSMAIGQIQSLVIMAVVILLFVSVLFIDLRAGLLALVPNVFPVVILFGVMGYLSIPLDTGTTMVAVIALGICVDDTIHFLSRYHLNTRGVQDTHSALMLTIEQESTPIITTSLALALGFATLAFSSFQPVIHFGLLSSMVMLLALFSTFILTPVLLSYTRLVTAWEMLSLNLKSDVIRKSRFFMGLNAMQIKKAMLSGAIREYQDGEIMIEQGSEGAEMYVLLEGKARVSHKETDGSVHTLGYLSSGELFGEISHLAGESRSARVTADGQASVLTIQWNSIRELGRFHPRVSMVLFKNLATILSKRFTVSNTQKDMFRDELTGAMTKGFFCEQLQLELARCRRFHEKLSAIVLDIELVGFEDDQSRARLSEAATASITRLIQQQSRSVDIFARWDEFCFAIVLPRTHPSEAIRITDRIKEIIEDTDLPDIGRAHIRAVVAESDGKDSPTGLVEAMLLDLLRGDKKNASLSVRVYETD